MEIDIINIEISVHPVLVQAVSEETASQGPSDSEIADQNSTGESHQTENILHNAICLT